MLDGEQFCLQIANFTQGLAGIAILVVEFLPSFLDTYMPAI